MFTQTVKGYYRFLFIPIITIIKYLIWRDIGDIVKIGDFSVSTDQVPYLFARKVFYYQCYLYLCFIYLFGVGKIRKRRIRGK